MYWLECYRRILALMCVARGPVNVKTLKKAKEIDQVYRYIPVLQVLCPKDCQKAEKCEKFHLACR